MKHAVPLLFALAAVAFVRVDHFKTASELERDDKVIQDASAAMEHASQSMAEANSTIDNLSQQLTWEQAKARMCAEELKKAKGEPL